MMHVGIVRMRMNERLMHVRMGVRLVSTPDEVVRVPVVLIVNVRVRVLLTFVRVQMVMSLADVQVDAGQHQAASRDELPGNNVALKENRERGAEEWSDRKIGTCPGASKMAKREDEQGQTHAVTEKSDPRGAGDNRERRHAVA